jgi:hypothetical protein
VIEQAGRDQFANDLVLSDKEKESVVKTAVKSFKEQQQKLIYQSRTISGFDARSKLIALQKKPELAKQWIDEQTIKLKAKIYSNEEATRRDLVTQADQYASKVAGPIVFSDESTTLGARTIKKLAERTDLDQVIQSDKTLLSGWLNDPRLQNNGFKKDPEYRTILAQGPSLKFLLSEDAGVHEHYTIGEHQGRVIDIYESQKKYYQLDKIKLPAGMEREDLDRFFRTMLAYHDIGKSIAVRAGNKDLQHEFIVPLLTRYLKADHFSQAEINLAVAIVDHDSVGDYLKGASSLEETTKILKERAVMAGMNEKDFFKLQMLFYTSDSASYPFLTHMVFGVPESKTNAAFYKSPPQKLSVTSPKFKDLAKNFGGA